MLDRLHNHITGELHINTRMDMIVNLTVIIFNFVMLGINSAMATGATHNRLNIMPMIILTITLVHAGGSSSAISCAQWNS